MNKKGLGFTIVMCFVGILAVIISAVLSQTLNARRLTKNVANSARAFYAAESGVNKAIWALNNYEDDYQTWTSESDYPNWLNGGWSVDIVTDPNLYVLSLTSQSLVSADGNTTVYYHVHIEVDPNNPQIVTVYSDGYSPTVSGAQRSIKVVVRKVVTPDESLITGTIETSGSLSVGGGATVTGDSTEYSTFVFEDIFGASKADIKALANVEIDPLPNYDPVQDITWFDLVENNDVQFTTSLWSGTGIMIVDGDLKITGGTFTGIIWVTGNADLDIAGNAVIEGAIFVEGNASIIGSATISFDGEGVGTTLDEVFPQNPVASWEEAVASWEQMQE